jgi:hypothetical protein
VEIDRNLEISLFFFFALQAPASHVGTALETPPTRVTVTDDRRGSVGGVAMATTGGCVAFCYLSLTSGTHGYEMLKSCLG